MKVKDIFSKRNKPADSNIETDINYFPKTLKMQVMHIVNDVFNAKTTMDSVSLRNRIYNTVVNTINHEYGVNVFGEEQINRIFFESSDIYFIYDYIELLFNEIEKLKVKTQKSTKKDDVKSKIGNALFNAMYADINIVVNDAIDELNKRFRENGILFRYESKMIIRIDSEFAYSEIIKPVIHLLQSRLYEGANNEFLSAFEHYKCGRNKECLNDCLKAYESVLKSICDKRRWKYDKSRDTAKRLIEICYDKKLIPEYFQTQLASMRAMLEGGIATIRNKESGHGQGRKIKVVDDYIAGYGLNITAATVLLLINIEKTR